VTGPVLDPGVIDSLRQLTPPGEPDVLAEVLNLFLQEVPRRIERLRAGWTAGDAAEVYKAAHSLKGGAGNVGAMALHAVCRQIDEAARTGDLAAVAPLIDVLDREYARVEVEVRRLLTQAP
jgi:HPt (histidine-containing phosphotransfer) domain-containing protein